MLRRIAALVLLAPAAAFGLTGCNDPKSADTGGVKPSVEKTTKNGKGKLATDDIPPPPQR